MSALAIGSRPRLLAVRLPALPAAVVFPAFIVLAGFVLSIKPALDPDLGVHIRTGAQILASHAIPRTETFSGPLAGAPWADFEWLWEVGLTLIRGIGGTAGLVAANAALVATTLGLVYARIRLAGSAPLIATCAASLTLASVLVYADVRPGMVGFIFEGLFLTVLELSRARREWRWLLLLLPAELVWANSHGSYAVGPLLCGLYAVASLWERQARGASLKALARVAAGWGALGLGLVAVSVVNPMGFDLLRFTLGAGNLSFNRAYVGEWRSPDLGNQGAVALLACLVASIALPLFGRARLAKREALLVVVCSLAAIKSMQFLPLYAVAAAPLLARILQPGPTRKFAQHLTPVMALALGGCLAVLGTMSWQVASPTAAAASLVRQYPVAAVQYIQEHDLQGPLFNDYDWGSYLIANLPHIPVFVDGRAELYGDAFLQKYMDAYSGKADPRDELDGYGVNLVLVPPKAAMATILRRDPDWTEAFRDETASVFTRHESAG